MSQTSETEAHQNLEANFQSHRKVEKQNKTKPIQVSLFEQLLETKGQKLMFINNPTCARHCNFPPRITSSLGSSRKRLLIMRAQGRFSKLPKVS